MTLPDLEGVEITGLTVRFGESFNHFAFAITDTVPESGSTLGLMSLGLVGLLAAKKWR